MGYSSLIADLLLPISQDMPCGPFLRYEGVYDKISEARRADEDLPRGIWEIDLKKAEWPRVADLCLGALKDETKDLQIAAWLMEAWVYTQGFAGVSQGVELLKGLAENFWETLHPSIDEGDDEFRLAPFEWINEHLSEVVRFLGVTSPSNDVRIISLADLMDAQILDKNVRRHKEGQLLLGQAKADGRPTLELINLSAFHTSTDFFQKLSLQIQVCREDLIEAERVLQEKNSKISFYKLRNILEEIARYLRQVLEERSPFLGVTETEDADSLSALEDSLHKKSEVFKLPSIGSRAEAYACLNHVADYLIKTEPHSPAPYLVKRAVTWGSMQLADLFQELIQDDGNLKQLSQLLGMQKLKNLSNK